MPEWRTVRVRQELVAAAKRSVEKRRYQSLSKFVSEAVRLRLDELERSHKKITEKQTEYPVIHERMLYTPNHMWTIVTPEVNIRVGLSDYAQNRLKGIAGIQTHTVGYEVKKGEPLGVIETWMFMFDLCSPVSGKIIKVNEVLQSNPFIIDKDPCELWIAEIRPNNTITLEEELRDLMKSHEYKMWVNKLSQPRILSL